MVSETDAGQARASDHWVELANGGGVMYRDPTQVPLAPPVRYTRRRQQLPRANDGAEP